MINRCGGGSKLVYLLGMVAVPVLFAADNVIVIEEPVIPPSLNRVYGEAGVQSSSKDPLIQEQSVSGKKGASAKSGIGTAGKDTESYKRVTLKDVVLETVSISNNIKAGREKVIQSRIKLDDGYAAYHPTIDLEYGLTRTKATPGEVDTDDDINYRTDRSDKWYNDENYELTITQNLYSGGATGYKIDSLERSLESAKNRYLKVIVQEVENAIKAYMGVVFSSLSVNVNQGNMDRLQEILDIVTIKYDSGAMSIGDLSAIKASVHNARSKLLKVQSKFTEALDYYEYVVGNDFTETIPFQSNINTQITDFETVLDLAMKQNLNIVNYRLNIQSEKYKLKNANAEFLPKVDLSLSANRITAQEDINYIENEYAADLTVSYNLYNGGKDKNKYKSIHSAILELNHRLDEEIRKLKWQLSKLHTSVTSLSETIKSTEQEVAASRDTVNAYWDAFRLGEQDLQQLLQAQRQLNSAELDLIESKQGSVRDFFKILSDTGELLNYFGIRIWKDDFIDFTDSPYQRTLTDAGGLKRLEEEQNLSKNMEMNATADHNLTDSNLTEAVFVAPEIPNDTNLSFKEWFLEQNETLWSVEIAPFDSEEKAETYIGESNLSERAFEYVWHDGNTTSVSVAHGVYADADAASLRIEHFYTETSDEGNSTYNFSLSRVGDVKSRIAAYEAYLEQQRKAAEAAANKAAKKPKPKPKPFRTDPAFKKRFLESDENAYTINVASFGSMKEAEVFVKRNGMVKNSFIFEHGEEVRFVKVMYGIYPTEEEARSAIDNLGDIREDFFPVVEHVGSKQALYDQYRDIQPEQLPPEPEESKKVMGLRGDLSIDPDLQIAQGTTRVMLRRNANIRRAPEGARVDVFARGTELMVEEFDESWVRILEYAVEDSWETPSETIYVHKSNLQNITREAP